MRDMFSPGAGFWSPPTSELDGWESFLNFYSNSLIAASFSLVTVSIDLLLEDPYLFFEFFFESEFGSLV
jgi:hypothetical protein